MQTLSYDRRTSVPKIFRYAIIAMMASITLLQAETFTDTFDDWNSEVWGCEFTCPTVENGYARFNLIPGDPRTDDTWSKLSFRDKMFGYGTYSMTFRYSRRPLEAETWAGWALYSEADGVQEINFGIETACKSRCDDETLIFESYKKSVNSEVIVALGVNLFDGSGDWHTAQVTYTPTLITMSFDGEEVASITDGNTIPDKTMKLIPGARVVTGSLDSPFYLDVDEISFTDDAGAVAVGKNIRAGLDIKDKPAGIYNTAGRKIGELENSFLLPESLKGEGIYIVGAGAAARKAVYMR